MQLQFSIDEIFIWNKPVNSLMLQSWMRLTSRHFYTMSSFDFSCHLKCIEIQAFWLNLQRNTMKKIGKFKLKWCNWQYILSSIERVKWIFQAKQKFSFLSNISWIKVCFEVIQTLKPLTSITIPTRWSYCKILKCRLFA